MVARDSFCGMSRVSAERAMDEMRFQTIMSGELSPSTLKLLGDDVDEVATMPVSQSGRQSHDSAEEQKIV